MYRFAAQEGFKDAVLHKRHMLGVVWFSVHLAFDGNGLTAELTVILWQRPLSDSQPEAISLPILAIAESVYPGGDSQAYGSRIEPNRKS